MARKRTRASALAGHPPARSRAWLLLPALLIALLAAYQPAWHGGPIWDDEGHLTRPELRSAEGLGRIWSEVGATQQYYPVAHSAFWIEHALWGDNPTGYHLAGIALHAVSAFLLFLILRRLDVPGAVLAAVIFALHPIQVESVAWISELKNTLSGVFLLGAALAYLRYENEGRRPAIYVLSFVLFLMAVLSKTVAAVLPAALLIVGWWRRGTIEVRRDFVPLVPFFAAGLAAGLLTAWVERTFIGAAGPAFDLSAAERILVAGRALWFYAGKLFWPVPLIFNYPRWTVDTTAWWQYLFPLGAAAAFAACWALRRRTRAPLAGLALFAVALFPALGFVSVFPFRYSFVADHFAYLAAIPFAALAAARVPGRAIAMAACVAAAVLGALTHAQSRDYRDAETLYRATIQRNPSSWLAQNNLGRLLLGQGRTDEALAPLEAAARLQPAYAEPFANLGRLHVRRGEHALAVEPLETALKLDPANAPAHYNLGVALQALGRAEAAAGEFAEAARLQPGAAEPEFALGNVLQGLGRPGDAIAHYETALRSAPMEAAIHNNLGGALVAAGRLDEAAAHFSEALRLRPDFDQARENLRRLRALRGR
jgi:tetratricopeptide (TPR) repeat protein